MKHTLEVDSVIKYTGQKKLLSDIYLSVKTGEITGILGRNGSGKSALLKIIFGILRAERKNIRFDGKVVHQPFTSGNLIAYLPQHSFLPKSTSVTKIVDLFLKSDFARNQLKTDPWIHSFLKKSPGELSGGQNKYLEVSLILHAPVHFVLLDEPFTGIEPLYTTAIQELVQKLGKEKGILVTDHDFRLLLDTCENTYLLASGVLKKVIAPEFLEHWNYIPPGTLNAG